MLLTRIYKTKLGHRSCRPRLAELLIKNNNNNAYKPTGEIFFKTDSYASFTSIKYGEQTTGWTHFKVSYSTKSKYVCVVVPDRISQLKKKVCKEGGFFAHTSVRVQKGACSKGKSMYEGANLKISAKKSSLFIFKLKFSLLDMILIRNM